MRKETLQDVFATTGLVLFICGWMVLMLVLPGWGKGLLLLASGVGLIGIGVAGSGK